MSILLWRFKDLQIIGKKANLHGKLAVATGELVKNQMKFPLLINSVAFYSRRNDSKKFDNVYKVVKASRRRLEDNNEHLGNEGGPNWELFSPRGNRFYLPGSLGPAWQGASTTIQTETPLDSLICFESKAHDKLHVSTKKCPQLIRKSLHELFPSPEVLNSEGLTLITLQYNENNNQFEQGARQFVLAAREICSRLRLSGFWADFMNPFSGKPFYSYASGKNLYKIDERFRGLNMKLKHFNECIIICSDNESAFSGEVFTNAPSDLFTIKSLIEEQ